MAKGNKTKGITLKELCKRKKKTNVNEQTVANLSGRNLPSSNFGLGPLELF